MKKPPVTLVLGVVAIALALAGCRQGATAGPSLSSVSIHIPWPDHEVSEYLMLSSEGKPAGSAILSIEREGGFYLFRQTFTDEEGQLIDESTLRLRAADLKPTSEDRVLAVTGGMAQLSTRYDGGRVYIRALMPDGTEYSPTLGVPQDGYDNNEVLLLVRALPLRVDYRTAFTSIVTANATRPTVTVTVVGRETVEVPAGRFDSYRVEISTGNVKLFLWYGVDEPHYLVRYEAHTIMVPSKVVH
jgi:hypothetical protein